MSECALDRQDDVRTVDRRELSRTMDNGTAWTARAYVARPGRRRRGERGARKRYREPRMAGAYCLVGESSFAHIMAACSGLASGNCHNHTASAFAAPKLL